MEMGQLERIRPLIFLESDVFHQYMLRAKYVYDIICIYNYYKIAKKSVKTEL